MFSSLKGLFRRNPKSPAKRVIESKIARAPVRRYVAEPSYTPAPPRSDDSCNVAGAFLLGSMLGGSDQGLGAVMAAAPEPEPFRSGGGGDFGGGGAESSWSSSSSDSCSSSDYSSSSSDSGSSSCSSD